MKRNRFRLEWHLVRVFQATGSQLQNTIGRAEDQIGGYLLDPATGLPFANIAELTWDSGATLQSSTSVVSGWADEAAQSPYTVDPSAAAKFYRLKKQHRHRLTLGASWPGSHGSPASFLFEQALPFRHPAPPV